MNTLPRPRPLVVIILDGWGLSLKGEGNAVEAAANGISRAYSGSVGRRSGSLSPRRNTRICSERGASSPSASSSGQSDGHPDRRCDGIKNAVGLDLSGHGA